MNTRKQLRRVADMEDRLHAIKCRAGALITIGPTLAFAGCASGAICQLGYDILADAEQLDSDRCRLSAAIEALNRETKPAN